MRALLNDIRLLKLAELYERAYEQFVLELAENASDDPEVLERLKLLVSPDDRHGERISEQLERLNREVTLAERADVVRAAIMDVCDVERSAREFYVRHIDDLRDPQVAKLFRELAAEEARHARIATDALRVLDRRHGGRAVEALRIVREPADEIPMWEDVLDPGAGGSRIRSPKEM